MGMLLGNGRGNPASYAGRRAGSAVAHTVKHDRQVIFRLLERQRERQAAAVLSVLCAHCLLDVVLPGDVGLPSVRPAPCRRGGKALFRAPEQARKRPPGGCGVSAFPMRTLQNVQNGVAFEGKD